MKQVGRELGVRYVLEGSVRKSGNRIRVTAQLVEAATGNHVWAERYDRDLADIFAVQDEITERVVAAIEPELYAAEQIRSQSKPPDSLDAWECVIRALSLIGQGTRDENTEAEALCRRAIAIAPGYGRAHSLLAWALLRRTTGPATSEPSCQRSARKHGPHSGSTTAIPGRIWRTECCVFECAAVGEAERAFRRALELNPNFALAHARLAGSLAVQGARQEAADSAEHALRLSPRDRNVGTYASLDAGGCPFRRRALSRVRHLGAQRDREKSRNRSGTFLSDGGAGDGGRSDRSGGGAGNTSPPPARLLR